MLPSFLQYIETGKETKTKLHNLTMSSSWFGGGSVQNPRWNHNLQPRIFNHFIHSNFAQIQENGRRHHHHHHPLRHGVQQRINITNTIQSIKQSTNQESNPYQQQIQTTSTCDSPTARSSLSTSRASLGGSLRSGALAASPKTPVTEPCKAPEMDGPGTYLHIYTYILYNHIVI